MPKLVIKKVKKGRHKGEFRFVLKADNHENLSPQETYTQKHNIMSVAKKYFPNFEIIDESFGKTS